MTVRLTGVRGPLTGRTFELSDQPLTIGRAADNHIAVASPRASRRHAQIRREGAAFVLYDLGSANGTLVNGQRVQRAVLQPGDLIDIGDEVFRFEAAHPQDATVLGAPAAPPPPAPSPYPPVSYPPAAAPPTAPVPAATPYPAQPGTPPYAYPPQPVSPLRQQPPPTGYTPGYAPGYAPPLAAKRSGRFWLLATAFLLTLVCVIGAVGAVVFRESLRDLPVIRDMPDIGGVCPEKTNDPAMQDQIGDVQRAVFALTFNGNSGWVQITANSDRLDPIPATCMISDGRYVITLKNNDGMSMPPGVTLTLRLQFNNDRLMTGEVSVSAQEYLTTGDVTMQRLGGPGQPGRSP